MGYYKSNITSSEFIGNKSLGLGMAVQLPYTIILKMPLKEK